MDASDVIMLLMFWGVAFFIASLRTEEGGAFFVYTLLASTCFALIVKVILVHYV